MEVIERVREFVLRNDLVGSGEKILLGFSGGPDSVFLFEALLDLKEEFKLEIAIAHINHLLRGDESDGDEEFCRQLAEKNGIKYYVKKADIKKYSRQHGIGEEEAGRSIRYDFFYKISKEWGADKVALAHNKDDQVETFLFRMMRGTSLEGLEGIPVRRDIFIRPLSEVYKKDILGYLDSNKIEYRIDSSNLENTYTRNSIRLDLIPFIEDKYNANFKEKIFSLIEEIKEANKLLKVNISDYIENEKLDLKKLEELHEYQKRKVINEFLKKYKIEITREKLENILDILKKGGSKKLSLGKNIVLKKEYDKISVKSKETDSNVLKDVLLKIPGEVKYGNYRIKAFRDINNSVGKNEFCTNLQEGMELLIRKRKSGDRIQPVGMNSSKKIKDIFINEKIPKEAREVIPILVLNDEIVWIASVRGNEKFKSVKSEKIIVKLSVEEDNFSE
ncbi:tRNA lysidine(34) synthetase TilS [Ilyobacter polytropus]|uniref:tRNA(Ile)-lysidine synthase n=1 Tax=Ilyobacter polytropus (strain ATCC 51220 / DSM 2926 / LMG 16218 / CuHBu1) TaxID=572544 RepID=E3H9Y6_ILYPC|nr:tRNA lysidine(34) synthetase TilS [Ilyobacter polytropus]ADO83114.1 tRNA(Ile)-lysidine synthetase [Ilyobacter polytropus DSM 2926]